MDYHTALKNAVLSNDKAKLSILLPENCKTALMFACQHPDIHIEILKKLLFQAGCRDNRGGTAMKRAIDANNSIAIEILLIFEEENHFVADFQLGLCEERVETTSL